MHMYKPLTLIHSYDRYLIKEITFYKILSTEDYSISQFLRRIFLSVSLTRDKQLCQGKLLCLIIFILHLSEIFCSPETKNLSCFSSSHSLLKTTFKKFPHFRRSCLERLPSLDTISTSKSSGCYCKTSKKWCSLKYI